MTKGVDFMDEQPEVHLAWHETAMASEIGRLRQLAAIKAGLLDRHGYAGNGWSEHIEGAMGELVVAKVLGIYWDGSVNTFSRDDLPGLQVRTRSETYYDLIVRPSDPDDATWVLVTGKCPSYVVRGWIKGSDAKQPQWMKDHGSRPDAFFVPQEALRPILELCSRNKITH